MIKKIHFFLCIIHGLFIGTVVQAFTPLGNIDLQGFEDLSVIKQQVQNVKFEDVIFDAFVDGSKTATLQRRGILVRRSYALGTVLICHGYLGCKRDAIAFKHLFPLYNVMSFDFRAHGDDREGQVSTIGRDEAFDVIGAVQLIKADPLMRDKPVIVFGYSMGAVSAINAQAMDQTLFDAMILDCPYDSTDAAMKRGLDEHMHVTLFGKKIMLPGKQFILDHMYDETAQVITNFLFRSIVKLDCNKVTTKFVRVTPVESVKKITVPCFFIHCENDKKVPIHAVEQLYNNKPGFKRLWITKGKQHFGSYLHNPELYWYKVNKFLTKLHQDDIQARQQAKIRDERTQVTISNAKPLQMQDLIKNGEPFVAVVA